MRSLPPPRITRARKWKRIKRAFKSLFTKGYISDHGAFVSTSRTSKSTMKASISTIKRSRISSRFRKRNFTDGVDLADGANLGLKTMGHLGRLATRASFPLFNPLGQPPEVNLTWKF
ncbi:predicted protein [Scheffersomyces stipitis CBS 6054]|uniref:Uncharacterized protein n=1 Tax=Scheffersomyces stipitis (strain ATCC 58785 / CBS 6054 / NBRC 10063 / NRRL Y-11545) TaxID=322104 RepID=A3LQ85_PICST|nr:predicted protein [Scheffersomyces stipitis CBS 6054]ABN64637.1 predicted protein [Scheffersomyces stipitis CBS 6054]KAG2736065.1 hypothetical protein G9P44_000155 [Scheffersomyces stipitis]